MWVQRVCLAKQMIKLRTILLFCNGLIGVVFVYFAGAKSTQSRYLFALACFEMDSMGEAEAALLSCVESGSEVCLHSHSYSVFSQLLASISLAPYVSLWQSHLMMQHAHEFAMITAKERLVLSNAELSVPLLQWFLRDMTLWSCGWCVCILSVWFGGRQWMELLANICWEWFVGNVSLFCLLGFIFVSCICFYCSQNWEKQVALTKGSGALIWIQTFVLQINLCASMESEN